MPSGYRLSTETAGGVAPGVTAVDEVVPPRVASGELEPVG
jgi:hypothetical protein